MSDLTRCDDCDNYFGRRSLVVARHTVTIARSRGIRAGRSTPANPQSPVRSPCARSHADRWARSPGPPVGTHN